MKRKCTRKDCFAYTTERKDNRCDCLNEVYDNVMECPFYKNKKTICAKKIEKDIRRYSGPRT